MKTKEFIEMLQNADPSGEATVNIEGADVCSALVEPYYWDGHIAVIERVDGYPAKASYLTEGDKLTVKLLTIEDCLWESDREFEIDYSGLGEFRESRARERHEKTLARRREILSNLELEHFTQWGLKKASELVTHTEGFRYEVRRFYADNVDFRAPIKVKLGQSYNTAREEQWEDRFEVFLDREANLGIRAKSGEHTPPRGTK